MNTAKYKAIRCIISRGGFSDERVFTFPHNGAAYEGIASRRHMWNETGRPLEDGEPPLDQQIDGFVAARVLRIVADRLATVSIPDGEVITIPVSELVERPVGDHVPV